MSNPQNFTVMKVVSHSHATTANNLGVALNGSAPFSVDAWIKFNGLCSMASILQQANGFDFGISGDCLQLSIAGFPTVQSNDSVQKLDDIDWHYVCVTFDGSNVRFYIDGNFNYMQSYFGNVGTCTNPFDIACDLQAFIKTVRVYNSALPAAQVMDNMFNTPPTTNMVACFDFTQVPPVDTGPGHYPITLQGDAMMVTNTPALGMAGTAYAKPINNELVNPGGQQIDPYTVQAWIYIGSPVNPLQTVFVNSDTESDTGMSLFVLFDNTAQAYRAVSQRGSNIDAHFLRSQQTIPQNQWVNLATTFDGTTLSLYVNGVLDSTSPFGPISLVRNESDLLIGASLSQGGPVTSTSFQGYINRVDVWSVALTAAQVLQYCGPAADVETPGLAAIYDFTSNPARNQVTQTPIGLTDGAMLLSQIAQAYASAPQQEPLTELHAVGGPLYLPPEQLAAMRAELDFTNFLSNHRGTLQAAMESDIAQFAGNPGAQEKIRSTWADQIERMEKAPHTLPFFLSTHSIGADKVLVCHTDAGSHVVYRAQADLFDDCTLWKVQLVFTVVAGILDALVGLRANLSRRAIGYIATILRNARVTALLANGSKMTAATIFTLGAVMWQMGAFKELLYMIVDLGFWAFLRVVARLILKLLGVGAVDVVASLIATAATFIFIYTTQRPSSCDPLPNVNLAAIKFNYDPSLASTDALSIRKDRTTAVSMPEWVSGQLDPVLSPVAYSIAAVTGKTITIQAKFTISTNASVTAQVKATGGGILGQIDPFTVNFVNGVSAPVFVTISLPHHSVGAAGVQIQNIMWSWFYQPTGGSWNGMGSSYHRIYAVLGAPNLPWVQSASSTNTQLPWVTVLEYACTWANGKANAVDAATAVTQKVYNGIGLTYDIDKGASKYTTITGASPSQSSQFLCTNFVSYLKGGSGLTNIVNCTDCATIVTTFANILGCNLTESTMYNINSAGTAFQAFKCNKIIAIGGGTTWEYPFPTKGRQFSYHEVAWTGGLSYPDRIFDACLELDGGNNPWDWTTPSVVHVATLPVNMVFSGASAPTVVPVAVPFTLPYYQQRLAQNTVDGIGNCLPRGPFPTVNTQSGHRFVI